MRLKRLKHASTTTATTVTKTATVTTTTATISASSLSSSSSPLSFLFIVLVLVLICLLNSLIVGIDCQRVVNLSNLKNIINNNNNNNNDHINNNMSFALNVSRILDKLLTNYSKSLRPSHDSGKLVQTSKK